MAIYDPADGSIDPRPRCTGNCCRCFSTEFSYSSILADYEEWKLNSNNSKIPQIDTIAQMLIPLGKARGQEIFTCKHLSKEGNCQIYDTRPQMCRDFPGPNPCPYRNCASHGPQSLLKRAWNWLRD